MANSSPRVLRVVQWTTGNVAKEAVKAVSARPDLDLVGAFAYSPTKVGVDIGTLCGLGHELGVRATGSVADLLALRPDCIIYNPLHFDATEVARFLRAGVNIVTSAEFVTGINLPESVRNSLQDAAIEGGATLFGSGMNPGFAQLAAAVSGGICTNVRHASMTESVDVSQFIGDANFAGVGWGRPKDDPGHAADVRAAVAVFAEAVDMFARLLHVDLDDIECGIEFAHATEDVVTDGVTIKSGHVGAMDVRWSGMASGREVISVNQRWVATPLITPAWTVEHGYLLDIKGDPSVHVRLDLMPTDDDLADLTPERMRAIALRITAAPLVNAIPAVCAAAPGIATYADLPTIAPILLP